MRVIILPDAAAVSKCAADAIEELIRAKPAAVLGLASGGTPMATYTELIRRHGEKSLSFAQVTTFNLDEYVGLAPDNEHSYRAFMNEAFFSQIDISISRTHVPFGDTVDLEVECARYERAIRECGGIDLQLLGIGRDGHVGFNEPGSSLGSRTRVKTLTDETIQDNARFFAAAAQVPTSAITMGIGTILDSRQILLLACGDSKARAIEQFIEGPITSMVTASILQMHPCVTVILDEGAASKLSRKSDYLRAESVRRALPRSKSVRNTERG